MKDDPLIRQTAARSVDLSHQQLPTTTSDFIDVRVAACTLAH